MVKRHGQLGRVDHEDQFNESGAAIMLDPADRVNIRGGRVILQRHRDDAAWPQRQGRGGRRG
jgi:hypothetical protein